MEQQVSAMATESDLGVVTPDAIDPQVVLDSLSSHIAIVDSSGTIVKANRAWDHCFSRRIQGQSCVADDDECKAEGDGPGTSVGTNYLEVCRNTRGPEEPFARATLEGIESVLERRQDEFHLFYPCAWPVAEGRLEVLNFLLTVTPLKGGGAVIAHQEIPKDSTRSN